MLNLDLKDDFIQQRRGNLILIGPSKTKHTWARDERVYRSLIVTDDGRVVSSGFPKFGNFREPGFGDCDRTLIEALENNGRVYVTEKLDGTLCIRSVVNGEVMLRTRMTFDGGEYGPRMRAVAQEKYPKLLDPGFPKEFANHSLLFEYVSNLPEFANVIRYPEEDLILIGIVNHQTLQVEPWQATKKFADKHGFKVPPTYPVPRRVDELVYMVSKWNDKEGVVVRAEYEGSAMVKIKSPAYLALHRIRHKFTRASIFRMCEEWQVMKHEDFWQRFDSNALIDWELRAAINDVLDSYFSLGALAKRLAADLLHNVDILRLSGVDRKTFAVEYASKADPVTRKALFLLWDEKLNDAVQLLKKDMVARQLAEVRES
jgi:hypothetical protein